MKRVYSVLICFPSFSGPAPFIGYWIFQCSRGIGNNESLASSSSILFSPKFSPRSFPFHNFRNQMLYQGQHCQLQTWTLQHLPSPSMNVPPSKTCLFWTIKGSGCDLQLVPPFMNLDIHKSPNESNNPLALVSSLEFLVGYIRTYEIALGYGQCECLHPCVS